MAKLSKTQKAKKSANRAAKKEAARLAAEQGVDESAESSAVAAEQTDAPKEGFIKRYFKSHSSSSSSDSASASAKSGKSDAKPKKKRFQFFRDVKAEMKRVTWPTKQDVLRWSGVVVVALLFFGIYTALLDNAIITPLLVAFSSIGA